MNNFKKNIYKQSNNFCVLPTLNNVIYKAINFVIFDFYSNTNQFDYSIPNGDEIQYSIDNGITWQIATNQYTLPSPGFQVGTISNVPNGVDIKYRIVLSYGSCINQISNIIEGGNWQGDNLTIAQISWADTGTFEDRNGNSGFENITLNIDSIITSQGFINNIYWEIQNNFTGSWATHSISSQSQKSFTTVPLLNKYRLKVTTTNGYVFYSNILKYTGV
jgi:hypothetical protein